jgi:histidyl-tRNA synthetase
MEELGVFPEHIQIGTTALFFNTGETEQHHVLPLAHQLRAQGIACEIYHEAAKFDKQFKYAERKSIPYIVIVGSKEILSGTAIVKKLSTGEQREVKQEEIGLQFKP